MLRVRLLRHRAEVPHDHRRLRMLGRRVHPRLPAHRRGVPQARIQGCRPAAADATSGVPPATIRFCPTLPPRDVPSGPFVGCPTRVHQRGDRRGRQAVRPGRPPLQGCRHRHHRDPRGHRLHGDALPFQVLQPPHRRVRRIGPRTAPASSARSSTRFTRPAATTCRFSCASPPTTSCPTATASPTPSSSSRSSRPTALTPGPCRPASTRRPAPWPTRSCPRASSSTSRSR